MSVTRRGFLAGLLAPVFIPGGISRGVLMPVKPVIEQPGWSMEMIEIICRAGGRRSIHTTKARIPSGPGDVLAIMSLPRGAKIESVALIGGTGLSGLHLSDQNNHALYHMQDIVMDEFRALRRQGDFLKLIGTTKNA